MFICSEPMYLMALPVPGLPLPSRTHRECGTQMCEAMGVPEAKGDERGGPLSQVQCGLHT